ncbi:MAG TPA: hypothetical protein VH092_31225 [Urbifossiella sp.]|jgi:hypothetical protein|nr:hypothetical protein [Urbifossiella sp.]
MTDQTSPVASLTLRVVRERYTNLRTWHLLRELQRRGVVDPRSTTAYVRNVEGGWKKPSAVVFDAWLDILGLLPGEVRLPESWGDLNSEVTELRAARLAREDLAAAG